MSAIELYADVRAALVADATLAALVSGVYADAAPESATYPFVVIELAQVADVPFLGNGAPVARVVIATRIVDTDLGRIGSIRERIDAILAALAGSHAGQLVAVRRITERVDARVAEGTIERVNTSEHEFLLVPT